MSYFPSSPENWETIEPASAGFKPDALAQAVTFAEEHGSRWPFDLDGGNVPGLSKYETPPLDQPLGPFKKRGGPAGLILKGGKMVAQWGDVTRTDMTFSVAKSYLSVLAGLAVTQGLIRNIDDCVGEYVSDKTLFASAHNAQITWRHLLTQTSEWEGTLFDKPDLVDRNRQIGAKADNSRKGQHRDLQTPGTFFEYNDVRVNLFSLCLLHVFRKPLPDVLNQYIMQPIGASDEWRWVGYDNSWIDIDGTSMQSVPGGTHWGGGMQIGALDQARLALLIHNDGVWNGNRLLQAGWCEALHKPSKINAGYGHLWWLNANGKEYPGTPKSSYAAVGAGINIMWIDPDDDLIVVARWIDDRHQQAFFAQVVSALS